MPKKNDHTVSVFSELKKREALLALGLFLVSIIIASALYINRFEALQLKASIANHDEKIEIEELKKEIQSLHSQINTMKENYHLID